MNTRHIKLELALDRTVYLVVLLVVSALFVVCHAVLSIIDHHVTSVHWLILQLFDLDDENNLPTWFSSFLLTNAAILLWHEAQRASAGILHWRLLAAGFLLMAVDEVAGLHESVNTVIEMSWAVPASIAVMLLAIIFIPFLLSQPRRFQWMAILSGLIYLSGVLGVEMLSADLDEDALEYKFAVCVEEGLEMAGIWLFIRTLCMTRLDKPSQERPVQSS